nr:MAG TPA: hypothetical protein [Caudoviricetes sp.]
MKAGTTSRTPPGDRPEPRPPTSVSLPPKKQKSHLTLLRS